MRFTVTIEFDADIDARVAEYGFDSADEAEATTRRDLAGWAQGALDAIPDSWQLKVEKAEVTTPGVKCAHCGQTFRMLTIKIRRRSVCNACANKYLVSKLPAETRAALLDS